ncbi:hypothetical protein KEM48_002992 [Puccinia striiformis f. sp. tritici PST-130]|nr:hypothetical protein KEM48_002992 [Puccinia striiformis f. sp. tritici PST-130]
MLRAWLLLLPTLCYLKINLVGGVAIVAESVLSLNKYSPPVPIRSSNPLGSRMIEFATFPSYMNDVLQTTQCLQNLELAVGAPPPIRIGGTTQDRAVYDPNETLPVRFTLPPGQLVPLTLTFGPRFIELASRLKGATTIGFNRRLADVNNVGLAALAALQKMKNLYAIELGNEPEFWDPKSPENLAPLEGKSLSYVKSFGGHAYPQSACFGSQTSLPDLMDHSKVVSFVKHFQPEVLAAKKVQKPYHFSEVNSATCGGQGISATFGAGLWSMDFLFQSLIQGVDRVTSIKAPSARVHIAIGIKHKFRRLIMEHISQLWHCEGPLKSAQFRRPTRQSPRAGAGQVQIGGGYFDNATCKIKVQPKYDTLTASGNSLKFTIRKSEAVIIELDPQLPKKC